MNLLVKAIMARHATVGISDPTEISDLEAWYDANQIAGFNDGDDLTQWDDESGNNRDLTSATDPSYQTGIKNSLPAVYFDGTGEYIGETTTTIAQPITWFFVMDCDDAEGGTAMLIYSNDNADERTSVYSTVSDTPDSLTFYAGSAAFKPGAFPKSWAVVIMEFNGANSEAWVDGASLGGTGNPGTWGIENGYRIGVTASGSTEFTGYIGEFGYYSKALSDSERGDLTSYLGNKWAITVS